MIAHPNRKAHNWRVYADADAALAQRSHLFHGTVYDLGCGERPYAEFCTALTGAYVGVDWSDTLHSLTADVVADLNEPLTQVADRAAGTVLSISTMEHLHDPRTFLAEAARILRPGGYLVLQVPFQWRVHEAPHDYFRYTPYALRRLLGEAGFTDVTVSASAGLFTTLALKWNYFTRRFVRGPLPVRAVAYALAWPGWTAGQYLSRYLDRLDRDWAAECPGYWVTARRPPSPPA